MNDGQQTMGGELKLKKKFATFPLSAFAKEVDSNNDSNASKLDMLFIGAHPDDESGGLSTYGQWVEQYHYKMGVVTITRGEGGGNAVGPEEGADLGILREKEERSAVSIAGIRQIFNLDKVDFYYNVSAPLTEQVWGHDATLEKVVRTVRMTQPEIILTMNPSPTPGNHGHHQYAARMAVEAFYAAADPTQFPEQLSKEGLKPWKVKKLVYNGASGPATNPGAVCEASFQPKEPTDKVYSIWSGRTSAKTDKTWAQLEREAQRLYASQGWAVFADVPADPNQLGCDRFTEFDSRVPITKDNVSSTALLEGALLAGPHDLPLGTEMHVTTSDYRIAPGQSFTVTAEITNNSGRAMDDAVATLQLPDGLAVKGDGSMSFKLAKGQSKKVTFEVSSSSSFAAKRYRINVKLASGGKEGCSSRVIEGVSEVTSTLQPLSHVKQFQDWTKAIGVQHLENLIKPVFSIGVGETKTVSVDVTNNSSAVQNTEVSVQLPAGFQADQPTLSLSALQPGEVKTVQFTVKNTDTSLKTSNEGGTGGDYNFTVTTKTNSTSVVQNDAINLVPVTEIGKAAAAPTVDGEAQAGEYPGQTLDLSRVWEGQAPSSAADASGTAKVSWHDDGLYFYVNVVDDKLGTVLPQADAKRHWRTDSVEITIDPRGNSENTSSTFKVGIFPTTVEHKPAAYRDADNHQGPIAATAPGMEIASKIDETNYNGYTLEAKIPFSALPAAIDPAKMAFNIFIYDSDTTDKTGQTRLGWSTWGGVQGDPYRWGHGYMTGYVPDPSLPVTPKAPIIPLDVAHSTLSPQSILQSSMNGVPLASGMAGDKKSLQIEGTPKVKDGKVTVKLKAGQQGTANLFVWSSDKKTVDKKTVSLSAKKSAQVTLNFPGAMQSSNGQGNHDGNHGSNDQYLVGISYLLISYETADGKTLSFSYPLE
jgi:LmbE family N-acetylglucosaminyl deacetylase